jgi:hypothetical protein
MFFGYHIDHLSIGIHHYIIFGWSAFESIDIDIWWVIEKIVYLFDWDSVSSN